MTSSPLDSLDALLTSLQPDKPRTIDFITQLYAPNTTAQEPIPNESQYAADLDLINNKRSILLRPKKRRRIKPHHALKFQLGNKWTSLFALLAKESLRQYTQESPLSQETEEIDRTIAQDPFSIKMYEEKIATDSLHDFDENGIYRIKVILPVSKGQKEYHYCLKRYSTQDSYTRAERNIFHLEKMGAPIPQPVSVADHFTREKKNELELLLIKNRITIDHYVGRGETLQDRIAQLEKAYETNERLRLSLQELGSTPVTAVPEIERILEEDKKVIRTAITNTFKEAIDLLFELNQSDYDPQLSFHKETAQEKFYRRALDKAYPRWQKRLLPAELSSLEEAITSIARPLETMDPMLIHGDFHAKNIVYDDTGKPQLVDPERHVTGNIFGDVARLIFNHQLTQEEHQDIAIYAAQRYNQHQKQTSHESPPTQIISDPESRNLFLRAELLNYMQLAVLFQKKAVLVKGKERKTQAAQLANECYTEAVSCMTEIALTDSTIETSFTQVIATLESITNHSFTQITGPFHHLSSHYRESQVINNRPLTERSLLERTVAEELGAAHSTLNQLVRTRTKVERFFDQYLKWPVLAGVIGTAVVLGGYGLSSRIKDYFHQQEIAALQEKTRKEYEPKIHNKTPDEKLIRTQKEQYEQAHQVRTDLIYGKKQLTFGPEKYPYVTPYTLENRLGSWYDMQRRDVAPGDWEMLLTPIEYYALSTKVDVNLLRAMIASFDWLERNDEPNFSLNQKGEYKGCYLPINPNSIDEIGFNEMYDTCELTKQAINQNILGTAKRMSALLEKYNGNVASALWHFYKGDFYFQINSSVIEGSRYPEECFKEYWDRFLYEKEQKEETGKRPCTPEREDDFVNIALIFYERFNKEFGSGQVWEKSNYPSFKTPTNRDFYTP